MQTLKYINRSHGLSKKGNNYDITEVSDGLATFILANASGVGEQIEEMDLQEGDEFNVEVHVHTKWGGLRGTIVAVSE
jgi:hypothetical protein